MSSNVSNFSEEIAEQAACYGLPYGIFGVICWFLSLCSISLTKVRFPLFSPWLWFEYYKAQNPIMAIIVTVMTIGPTIYTCIHCHGEWMIVLIALGQLTPWSLKFLYDAWYEEIEPEEINPVAIDPENLENKRPRIIVDIYELIGSYLGLLLSASGWVGLTVITVNLLDLERVIGKWIFAIYGGPLLILMIIYCCVNCKGKICFYLLLSIHIIGSHIILAIVSNNLIGIPAGIEMISAIVFFIVPCERCTLRNLECTFIDSGKKRGPKTNGNLLEQVYVFNGPENDFNGSSTLSSVFLNSIQGHALTLSSSPGYPDNIDEVTLYSNYYEYPNIHSL
ncbi:25685_t:CDS:2 [Dentiscutata erythropus]|uniref:25685_t:CDS:1 n=1 Tax=Dentiscutata erythropus TaxID=1348616 RepID=A0A9N9FH22_9GLOM|nr:25685_t:CDS:2 [Dentiscutata erythropus]